MAAISVETRTQDDDEAGEEGEGRGRKSVKRGGGLGARSGAAGARGADRTYHQFEISLARLGASARAFDAVVLATPLEASHGLKLHGAPKQLNATRPYQRTCVTFVSGIVNPSYFGVLPLSTVQQDEDQARLDETRYQPTSSPSRIAPSPLAPLPCTLGWPTAPGCTSFSHVSP